MTRSVVPVVLAALVLAGCGGGPGGPPGTVHGTIVVSGGPPGSTAHSEAGTVIVRRGGAEVGRQDVPAGQGFTFTLDPGSYRLSVRGLGDGCIDTTVTVAASSDRSVDLLCQRK
ncbi:hypothetical protein ACFO1B_31270 [Dactylosporangium siamense]|uniref:Uncharacterized protein n=1 Tax=Dactylosporangium siamense TaxID=685454 RepID=A0A919PRD4_9ACTN|nr:hypothetical protein [Dactylosporangium siamense]GIG48764.1 hypothetical protein Dsi01nite_068050 [Dactylosporangium siamense]